MSTLEEKAIATKRNQMFEASIMELIDIKKDILQSVWKPLVME